ncbi:MAG: hypothetical protein A3F12_07090 [Gammaproteobacteria bacterium RIFCSPHIGHO2_12_FULL_38_14]|nr:MAG: hypothetical protein A3F12_07090 [Gammaproteobacteria bacterium RIFCSPHIGHO2_12_FULL_38_14]
MMEIIPNWHPIFVHFTVALFSASVGFYTLTYLFRYLQILPKTALELGITAQWCLWVVGILVVGTVLAGLHAYNTVRHDAPSHLAMINHRNWALITASAIILVSLWSMWRTYKHKMVTISFVIALFIVQGLLLATAWRGAELVFRYGLGVMSLPHAEGEGRHHHHEITMDHQLNPSTQLTPSATTSNHDHDSDVHHHQ